jgi:hypothetical protein
LLEHATTGDLPTKARPTSPPKTDEAPEAAPNASFQSILWGDYLFTVAPLNDGFSESPDQAKEFCFIRLDNGRLTIQPTNRVVFEDRSFTTGEPVPKLKLQTETWSCED